MNFSSDLLQVAFIEPLQDATSARPPLEGWLRRSHARACVPGARPHRFLFTSCQEMKDMIRSAFVSAAAVRRKTSLRPLAWLLCA
ncbi:MAG TPA: hypothetical protein VF450_25545, partial [Noviherbaspirillum sp.]